MKKLVYHAFMSHKEPLCEHDYTMYDAHERTVAPGDSRINCPTCVAIGDRCKPKPPGRFAEMESNASKRMRKERPTMAVATAPVGLEAWLKPWQDCPCGSKEHQKAGHPEPMPPIRCTATPPCGHCWYCLQYKTVRP